MISPFTKPGTEVIFIGDDEPNIEWDHMEIGTLCTVKEIMVLDDGSFGVSVNEINNHNLYPTAFGRDFIEYEEIIWYYDLSEFRYVDLAGLDLLLEIKENV